jgi:hypothetical protein
VATTGNRATSSESILEVRILNVDQIFDNHDPAPFRERDLDPDFVDYLVDGVRDLGTVKPIRIIVWLGQACPPGQIEEAVHRYFEHALTRIDRSRREQVRSGGIGLAIAGVAIVVLTALGQLVARTIPNPLGAGLQTALEISGWVFMWRPIEVLIYDGIPVRREKRVLRAIRAAPIDVRVGPIQGRPVPPKAPRRETVLGSVAVGSPASTPEP